MNKKAGILDQVFGDKVHAVTKAFLKLVVNKGRAGILFAISKAFISQYNLIKGIVTAEVTSATGLTDANRAEITNIVKKENGANVVVIKEKINEKLIGGLF